jgi:hypothetical protein
MAKVMTLEVSISTLEPTCIALSKDLGACRRFAAVLLPRLQRSGACWFAQSL